MFDISFGEILLICVVALVVLGPERLPAVARTLGALVARAQRFVASVKADIGQHADLAGLAALKEEVRETAAVFHAQLVAGVDEVQQTIHQARQETADALTAALPAPAADTVPADTAPADTGPTLPKTPAAPVPAAEVNENQLDLFADLPADSSSHESTR